MILYKQLVYFCYSMFCIYDSTAPVEHADWTERHSAQGFLRLAKQLYISTMLASGDGDVTLGIGGPVIDDLFQRVVAIPMRVDSGIVVISAPDDYEGWRVNVPSGNYYVYIAQEITTSEMERIGIWFERHGDLPEFSRIIRADTGLKVTGNLIEIAN